MIRTYCVSGVYPNDVRNELISDSNDDVVNMPRDSDKLDSRCNVLKARINICKGNVLIDSGAQISLISEKSVSYTHLDVYKRQVHDNSFLLKSMMAFIFFKVSVPMITS